MDISEYVNKYYPNCTTWFISEVKKPEHLGRVSSVISNKNYLNGRHKVLQRKDIKWKNEEYKVTKLILQEAKTILNFHSTYLIGKPLSLTGSENMIKAFNNVYRKGKYSKTDFNILDKVIKYGDCFEYVYVKDNRIVSKIINSENAYPIYNSDDEYIGFIEYIKTNVNNNINEYYNVYSLDNVEKWNDESGSLTKVDEVLNISGLPIHYHNFNEDNDIYGVSDLTDIIPILDVIEDLLSKMNDAVYTMSLNPLAVVVGQQLDNTINADGVGYAINLDVGDFKFANVNMDYSTIKLLLDTLHKKLEIIASIPSVCMGNTNISNVSEVSLNMLYNLSNAKALLNEQWMRDGLQQRFDVIQKLLELQGNKFSDDDYVDVEFNYSKPINQQELLQNLKTQWEMGAISIQSIIEKSNMTGDVTQELERIKKDKEENITNSTYNANSNNNTDENTTLVK